MAASYGMAPATVAPGPAGITARQRRRSDAAAQAFGRPPAGRLGTIPAPRQSTLVGEAAPRPRSGGSTIDDPAVKRLVVGITGASGTVYGVRLLEVLRDLGVETHLVMTDAARRVAELETGHTSQAIEDLASICYPNGEIAAAIASGSFRTDGMVVAPCSIKSLSAIARCYTESLLARAADVVLKERRRLVLVVRETPLHLGHLRMMAAATEYGAIILPPMPAFYHRPKTISDLVDQTVGKVLDQFGLQHDLYQRWQGGDGGHAGG